MFFVFWVAITLEPLEISSWKFQLFLLVWGSPNVKNSNSYVNGFQSWYFPVTCKPYCIFSSLPWNLKRVVCVWPDHHAITPMHRYANMSVQYTAIFNGCKNGNFQMKRSDVFLVFALNIDRGYSEAVLTSTHDLCFRAKIRTMYTPVNPSFPI